MAFKISVKDSKRIGALFQKFLAQASVIETAIETYNETVSEAHGKVVDEFSVLNVIRDDIRGVIEDLISEFDGEFDEKSDNWKDGDRGEATRTWIDRLGEIMSEFEMEIEIDAPEEVTFDANELDVGRTIEEGLPSEPEY